MSVFLYAPISSLSIQLSFSILSASSIYQHLSAGELRIQSSSQQSIFNRLSNTSNLLIRLFIGCPDLFYNSFGLVASFEVAPIKVFHVDGLSSLKFRIVHGHSTFIWKANSSSLELTVFTRLKNVICVITHQLTLMQSTMIRFSSFLVSNAFAPFDNFTRFYKLSVRAVY